MDEVRFYKDNSNEWRWRWVSANNVDILGDSSEGYVNLKDAFDPAHRMFEERVRYIDEATGLELNDANTDGNTEEAPTLSSEPPVHVAPKDRATEAEDATD